MDFLHLENLQSFLLLCFSRSCSNPFFVCFVPTCGTGGRSSLPIRSYLICISLFCGNAEWRVPTVAILVVEQPPCFPDKLVPVRLQTSGLRVGCLFVGLGVRCHVSPFRFPRLWPSCLNAHFALHQHEHFDEHSLQSPLFSTSGLSLVRLG